MQRISLRLKVVQPVLDVFDAVRCLIGSLGHRKRLPAMGVQVGPRFVDGLARRIGRIAAPGRKRGQRAEFLGGKARGLIPVAGRIEDIADSVGIPAPDVGYGENQLLDRRRIRLLSHLTHRLCIVGLGCLEAAAAGVQRFGVFGEVGRQRPARHLPLRGPRGHRSRRRTGPPCRRVSPDS